MSGFKNFIPKKLIQARKNYIHYKVKRCVKTLLDNSKDKEIEAVFDFIEKNPLHWFPYEWTKKYNPENISVHFDEAAQMHFVYHGAHKLYYPKNLSKQQVADGYNGILLEQDIDSPHRYEAEGFNVSQGDVISELGAAEASWALENIEKAKNSVYI